MSLRDVAGLALGLAAGFVFLAQTALAGEVSGAEALRLKLQLSLGCQLDAFKEASAQGPKESSLTPYWAQEAIGLPETLQALGPTSLPPIFVGAIDASLSGADLSAQGVEERLLKTVEREREGWSRSAEKTPHGTDVANLMIQNGPVSSGLSARLTWFTFLTEDDEDKYFESTYSVRAPRVVNISMGHRRRFTLEDIYFSRGEFKRLLTRLQQDLPEDVIFVKSAGNDFGEPLSLFGTSELSRIPHAGAVLVAHQEASDRLISVASVDATGFVSSFSSGGADVLLSAPGGYPLRSGTPEAPSQFGGTSAAAPLVSGAISTLLSLKPDLSLAEIKEILKRTALPLRGQHSLPGYGGYGALNLYQAALVTRELARKNSSLDDLSIWSELELQFQKHRKEALRLEPLSCKDKKSVVAALRRAFFLKPRDATVRELLGAAYKSEGYEHQALNYGPEQWAFEKPQLMRKSLEKHVLYLAQTLPAPKFQEKLQQLSGGWPTDKFLLDKLVELSELREDAELFEILLIDNPLGFSLEDVFFHASRARVSIRPLEHLVETDLEEISGMPLQFALSSLARKGSPQALQKFLPFYLQTSLHPLRVLENMLRQAHEAGNEEAADVFTSYLSQVAQAGG